MAVERTASSQAGRVPTTPSDFTENLGSHTLKINPLWYEVKHLAKEGCSI